MTKRLALSACLLSDASLVEIAASGISGGAPDRVLLMRYGANRLRDSRPPVMLRDESHAHEVVAATQAFLGNSRFNFDYDHAGMKVRDPKVVGEARASGWASGFDVDADGIWATGVEWTPAAAQAIEDREYRYVSPLFMVAREGRAVLRFTNASLTNLPALELEQLAASISDDTEEEDSMNLKAIAASLGLGEDADEAAIIAAITARQTTTSAVAAALGVDDGADLVAAAQAVATGGEPDPARFIPVAAHQEAVSAISAQLKPLLEERRERLVTDAIAAGQIVPAQKVWALGLLANDGGEEVFAAYLETAPKFAGGRAAPKGEPAPNANGLTAEEVAAAASWGLTTEEYLKSKQQVAAQAEGDAA